MDNLEMENQFAEDNTFYRLIDRLEDTVDGAKNAPFFKMIRLLFQEMNLTKLLKVCVLIFQER